MYDMKKRVNVGDTILVEQAWEDDAGGYHDEFAKVLEIDENGEMTLEFFNAAPEIREFLAGSDGYIRDNYEPE